ncbi:hypothetical protein [Primorskyibacter sp. 2E233]|uniref:hypothetical protein n=1 Tax=Primorskyibacter sp. 2E233 TaxID=3413431 RepID=UPI003BF10F12
MAAYVLVHGVWHPRLSEKAGLSGFVAIPGGHEVCATNPASPAAKMIDAGRD